MSERFRPNNSPANDEAFDWARNWGWSNVENYASMYESNQEFKNFVDNINEDTKILDLGSGNTSPFIRYLKHRGLNLKNIYSLDLDIRNLKNSAAREKGLEPEKNMNVPGGKHHVQADAKEIPIKNNSIDVVVWSMVGADNHEINKDMENINSEVARVMKDSGVLVYFDDDNGRFTRKYFKDLGFSSSNNYGEGYYSKK
jgi:SAM-dependent methyltransferase